MIQITGMAKVRRSGCYSMKDQLEGSCVLSKALSLSPPCLSSHLPVVRWMGREMAGPMWVSLYVSCTCVAFPFCAQPCLEPDSLNSNLSSTTHQLCRSCNLFVPQFPHLWHGDNDSYVPPGMLWGLQSFKVRLMEQGLAQSKLSVNVSSYFCARSLTQESNLVVSRWQMDFLWSAQCFVLLSLSAIRGDRHSPIYHICQYFSLCYIITCLAPKKGSSFRALCMFL